MRRDFRTAYLNALGFKGGSQLKTSLEAIFEHRIIDLGKLKKICNLFDIPNQYRSKVWKILLGVTSQYQESWDLVHEQRLIEYEDIKDAVISVKRVNGNLTQSSHPLYTYYTLWKENLTSTDELVIQQAITLAASGLAIIYTTKEQYFNYQNTLYHIVANNTSNNNTNNNNNNNTNTNTNNINNNNSNKPNINTTTTTTTNNNNGNNNKNNTQQTNKSLELSFSIFDLQKANSNNSNNDNNDNNNNNSNNNIGSRVDIDKLDNLIKLYTQLNPSPVSGDEIVNNNNNEENEESIDNNNINNGNNILKGFQIDETLKSIAEVFCYVCESEVDAYWCLNNFLNLPLKQYGHKDIGLCHHINSLSRLLEIHDRGLSFHFKHHKVNVETFSSVWFKSFFTCCFPTNSMDRIWDRIIGVSLDYMAYISLAILQSKKPFILDKTNKNDILNYLLNIKDLNIDMILEKSVELFEEGEK